MIPEEWHELYINGDINNGEGGIFFYYNNGYKIYINESVTMTHQGVSDLVNNTQYLTNDKTESTSAISSISYDLENMIYNHSSRKNLKRYIDKRKRLKSFPKNLTTIRTKKEVEIYMLNLSRSTIYFNLMI